MSRSSGAPAVAKTAGRHAGRAGREFVQGLERGFSVIRAFGADRRSLTIADVAGRTGLSRAVARRYLLTLQELGCVAHHDGAFALTPRVLDLGFTYLASIDVARVAQPFMEEVVEHLHESCSAAVLDVPDIVYVARVPAKRIMSINLVVGSRLPAHATSMGKVLLAHLPPVSLNAYLAGSPLRPLTKRTITGESLFRKTLDSVREHGWAFSDSESEDGIRTVAAPVFGHSGQVEAAINVAGHAARVSMRELKRRYLPVLLQAAARTSRALGAQPVALRSRSAPMSDRAQTLRPDTHRVYAPLRHH